MRETLVACLGIIALLSGCIGPFEGHARWPAKKYDRVVGYQFVNTGYMSTPFADAKGHLTLARLEEVRRRQAVLSEQQVHRLVDAIFVPDTVPAAHAVCYDPHHIFVFYSGSDPVAAFETCFRCSNSNCFPPSRRKMNVNYPKLAELCLELGLGVEAPADQQEASQKFDRENKPPTD